MLRAVYAIITQERQKLTDGHMCRQVKKDGNVYEK